jgi:hypothetical protein
LVTVIARWAITEKQSCGLPLKDRLVVAGAGFNRGALTRQLALCLAADRTCLLLTESGLKCGAAAHDDEE